MADSEQDAETQLPEVSFAFEVTGGEAAWGVSRVMVRERLCAPFEAAVEVSAVAPPVRSSLLGSSCALTIQRGTSVRRFSGVISAVQDLGVNREARVYEVRFSPAFATLALRGRNRVWQGVDALQVVREVLDDAQLYVGAAYTPPGPVAGDVPSPREYCVQFGESDLAFVSRLLAEEGVLFCFGDGGDGETLQLFDARGGASQPQLDGVDGAVPVHGAGASTAEGEGIRRIDPVSSLTTAGVTLRDTDFTHPLEPLASAASTEALSVEQYPGHFVLGAYDEGGHAYAAPDTRRSARIALQQRAAQGELVRGEGNVTGMRPGLRFSVEETGDRSLQDEFLLTTVLHVGVAPDVALGEGETREDRYRNVFECTPASGAWAPPRAPRPRVDHPQVATVSAEPGSSEEICTDFYGRVLVRFPWDRPESRGGSQGGSRTSCWLRVMQPWAGPNWGFHFTPRVGMEVVVHFLDGDPDRPYVAGCLPNAVNVPPVELPQSKTQSALRTQSSPGGGGYNELRFEDAAGAEEVYLRAQYNQRIEVLNDRAMSVGNDTSAATTRDEATTVGRDRTVDVTGHQTHSIGGNRQVSVGGDELHDVSGDRTVFMRKNLTQHIDQLVLVTANDGHRMEIGGNSGTSSEMTPGEITQRAPTKHLVAVGDEATAELTPERYEVRAPEGLALICGDTLIEIGTDKILLQTKGGAKIELEGDNITLKTTGKIVLKGSSVSNNG